MSQATARMHKALSSTALARRLSSNIAASHSSSSEATTSKSSRERREELTRKMMEASTQQVTMAKTTTPLAEATMAKLLVKRNYDPPRRREDLPPIEPLAAEVMPSNELIETISRDSKLHSKLAHRVAEVELLYSLSDEVPTRLGNDEWIELVDTPTAYERERYLRDLYTAERARLHREAKSAELTSLWEVRRQELTTRLNAGEMIYASGFHSLLGELRGEALRGMVDRVYGARCLAAKRVREPRAKLLVDCRSLRYQCIDLIQSAARQIDDLYSEMILQRRPFDVQIVNLFMEKSIARAIKSRWHFLFGPHLTRRLADKELLGRLDEADELGLASAADDETAFGRQQKRLDEAVDQMRRERSRESILLERHSDFTPHPFCPRLTTKGVRQALKVHEAAERELPFHNDHIAYISPAAKRFLPDDLSPFRVFILMAAESETSPLHGSVASALADQLPLYRIPIEKHIAWYHGSRWRLTLSCQAQLIHSVHSGRMDWQEALSTHLPKRYLRPQPFVYRHHSDTGKSNRGDDELAPPPFVDPLTGTVARSEGDEANEQHQHQQRLAEAGEQVEEQAEGRDGEVEEAQLSLKLSDFGLEELGGGFEAALPIQTELYDSETGEFFEYRGPFSHSNADPHLMKDEARRQRVKLMTGLERDSVTRRLRLNRRPHVWERGGGEQRESDSKAYNPAETIKYKRNHRYTREQRNAMRAQFQQLTE